MSLKTAFETIVKMRGYEVTMQRVSQSSTISKTVVVAPSNYFRKMEGPSSSVMSGKEYVISQSAINASGFPNPKRGDKIVDDGGHKYTIGSVDYLRDIGGELMGFRVRTE